MSPEGLLDEREVAEARRREAEQRRQAEDDLRQVLSTAAGRRFLWRLINGACDYNGTSCSLEHVHLVNHDAKRAVAVELINAIQAADPAGWRLLYDEALRAMEEAARVRDAARTSSTDPARLDP